MARDEGIRESYRISGIRSIGVAHVFPKTRVMRWVKKTTKKTTKEEKELPKKTKEETKEGIDIEV